MLGVTDEGYAQSTLAGPVEPTKVDTGYQLNWVRKDGAESCLSGAALARMLSDVLTQEADTTNADTLSAALPHLLLEGTASPAILPNRFQVQIRVTDEQGNLVGQRELITAEPKCSSLSSSVLLVLVMALAPARVRHGLPAGVMDELGRTEREDEDVWPKPASPKPASPDPAAAPVKAKVQLSRERQALVAPAPQRKVQVQANAGLSMGLLPSVRPGLGLGLRGHISSRWSVVGSGMYWFADTVLLPPPRGAPGVVEFTAVTLKVALCRNLVTAWRVSAEGCAGVHGGLRWVSSSDLAQNRYPKEPLYGPVVAFVAQLGLDRAWSIQGQASAQLNAQKDDFTYQDYQGQEQPLYRPSLLFATTLIGIGRAW